MSVAAAGEHGTDAGLVCLARMLRYTGALGSAPRLRHRFGSAAEKLSASDIWRTTREIRLKSGVVFAKTPFLAKSPLLAIAAAKEGGFFIAAKVAEDEALIHDPIENPLATMSRTEREALWNGKLIFIAARAGRAEAVKKFDLAWFVPAIAKYKRILAEVPVGSFALQLFGLVSLLFLQVTIDKVLQHRGLAALDELVVGLAVITLFELRPGGCRTHSTNRVPLNCRSAGPGNRPKAAPEGAGSARGIAATLEITAGKRKPIEFRLSPLMRMQSEAGRER